MEPSDNNKRIFTPAGCLEKDIMLEYLAGHTNAQQTRAIEMHIVDCPLCSDALDGLSLMDSRESLNTLLEAAKPEYLKQAPGVFELPEINGPSKTRRLQKVVYIGIAASLALLVVSYFSIRYLPMASKNKETLSYENTNLKTDKSEVTSAPVEEAAKNEVVAGDMPAYNSGRGPQNIAQTITVMDERNGEGEADKSQESQTNQKELSSSYYGYLDGIYTGTSVTENEQSEDQDAEIKDKEAKDALAEEKTVDVTTVNSLESVSRSGKKESAKQDEGVAVTGGAAKTNVPLPAQEQPQREVNKAIEAFQQGDYSGAADRFEEALSADPGQTQAIYYKGMSHYYLHQYPEALSEFQKVLKNKKDQYFEAAQWQIAVIYIETGEVSRARKTLNEVIDHNGSYRHPAEEAIKNLGDQ